MVCLTLVLDYALLSRERVKRTNKCSSTNKWSRVWCVWRGVNGTRVPLQCDCAPLCPFAPHHALWYSLRSYTQSPRIRPPRPTVATHLSDDSRDLGEVDGQPPMLAAWPRRWRQRSAVSAGAADVTAM